MKPRIANGESQIVIKKMSSNIDVYKLNEDLFGWKIRKWKIVVFFIETAVFME